MLSVEVRRGVTQAQVNEVGANLLYLEIFATAVITGLLNRSWWVFGGTLFALLVAAVVRPLAILLAAAYTIFWGSLGFRIGQEIGQDGAPVVLAALVGFIAATLHWAGIEWTRDMSTRPAERADEELLSNS
jgi:hypothetical protein